MSDAQWEPGRAYSTGSSAWFNGVCYRIIQPHTSQSDWTPPITPALWQPIKNAAPAEHMSIPQPQPDSDVHARGPSWIAQHAQAPFPVHQSGGALSSQLASSGLHEPRAPSWVSQAQAPFPVHRGTPANQGPAGHPSGGGGYDAWLADARSRAERFQSSGPRTPTTWLLHEGEDAPPSSLAAPSSHGHGPVYIRRRYFEGKIWLATYFPKTVHEVLVGDHRAIQWVKVDRALKEMNVKMVEGGKDDDGRMVYVGVGESAGQTFIGRATIGEALAVRRGNEIHHVNEYSVLCYL